MRSHAGPDENADLYWSARGSGPGFFGVVVAFHLRLYDKPTISGSSVYAWPIELMDDVYRWIREVGPDVDRRVEPQLLMSRGFAELGIDHPALALASPVFADSEAEAEAEAALALLDTCPVNDQALVRIPYAPAPMADWYDAVMGNYPTGHRYATDNMWTSASFDELRDGLHRIAETLPPSPARPPSAPGWDRRSSRSTWAGWPTTCAPPTTGARCAPASGWAASTWRPAPTTRS